MNYTEEEVYENLKRLRLRFYTDKTNGRKYRYSTIEEFARSNSETEVEEHIKEHLRVFLKSSSIDITKSYYVKLLVKEVSGKTFINISLVNER